MGRSTVHYTDDKTNNSLKKLHKLLRPAGTPVQRVEYIIELLLLRIFEVKLRRDGEFAVLRQLFIGEEEQKRLFSYLKTIDSSSITSVLNTIHFPFYGNIVTEVSKKIKNTELSLKIMDELILIQSVFSNSNFTNNVIGGNLQEVITEVSNIDETVIVKTDLLGDAIESALSETGGTKDIGLYRTPDHIRQFMVGLVEPTINDLIMDPACGTGGFLFDSYEYALARFEGEDAEYPGEKAHPELRKWFKKHFSNIQEDYPDDIKAQNFYRHGVYGIEYLGMIKKMAAVNLYIRGLNPKNIEQGDSLNKFGTSIMPDSKTVILANPPFGAETDQTSYPNVWEEFSTEKETTILFVKLMLDSLKKGGRCAVIVSEGFLTWDQTSAKVLREKLLYESNLKAVIGLPQGVFVSKNGVGPKTSILLFEKGGPTTKTWFYQVHDDGYTMGTNRKPKSNSQLVDALEIYHTYIKKGLTPPEKQNSFIIDANWIKSLDPRIKKRIREEVEEANYIKKHNDIEKRTSALFRKVESKEISEKELKFEIKQAEELWRSKIDAEIEQKIAKAYSFSYNPAAYHSTLNDTQLSEWKKLIGNVEPEDIDTLDKRYMELYTSELGEAFSILSKFNLSNAIEADIVREYVSNYISKDALEHYPKLKKIDAIFKMGAKYPMVKLAPYLIENTEKVKPNAFPEIRWRTLGVSNESGVFLNEKAKPEETNQSYYKVKKNEFCYNPYRVNVGSIGLNKFDYDNQIISGAYVVFGTKEDELLPEYLEILIKSKQFNDYVISKANVGSGVRMNFTFEDMGNWEIPLPAIDVQHCIISKIKSMTSIIDSCKNILEKHRVNIDNINNFNRVELGTICNPEYGFTASSSEKGKYRYIRITDISSSGLLKSEDKVYVTPNENVDKRFYLNEGDLLVARTGATYGKTLYWSDSEPAIYASYLIKLNFDNSIILNKYYWYYTMTDDYIRQKEMYVGGGTQPQFNANAIRKIKIPIPDTLEQQKKIILKCETQFNRILEIEELMKQYEIDLKIQLKKIWGEEE
ncbi:MAG: N-6 DNA methylase [Clostridiales bacterium]|jgi:type I restriction-modification system DNA methylase subunit/restriction endonuclease S subunit|nr:N-6 DNA methylase [Clostridiales bacterium]